MSDAAASAVAHLQQEAAFAPPLPPDIPATANWKRRVIEVTFNLGAASGSFSETSVQDANQVTLKGLRVSVQLSGNGTPQAEASVRIFGMTPSQMATLSTLGVQVAVIQARLNLITILAGDEGQQPLPLVFKGTIYLAGQTFDSMPDTYFMVQATSYYYESLAMAPPTSFQGPFEVAGAIGNLASAMGRIFHNYGVTTVLPSNTYKGTLKDQAQQIADEAGIEIAFDGTVDLDIWPRNGTRGDQVVVISRETGMIGFPCYIEGGRFVRCLFNPNVRMGSKIQLRTALPGSSGLFRVMSPLSALLESELPGGQWIMQFACVEPQYFGQTLPGGTP